ncbi:MAG: methyltransferase, partial [Candidatus Binataceae bacterium]
MLEGVVRWCKKHQTELPRLIGVESDPGRAGEAQRVFRSCSKAYIRQADFLTEPIGSFEFIIGNPPYVSIL